jgi:hypothetical protein
VGFAAKPVAPKVPLGILLVAASEAMNFIVLLDYKWRKASRPSQGAMSVHRRPRHHRETYGEVVEQRRELPPHGGIAVDPRLSPALGLL